tara:strand:- start:1443 stop:1706 length:264 start_codon:yes stop_codon:yes gene_type:complete
MAKKKRFTVGSIIKGQNGKPDYIKINSDVVLTKGQFVNMESKAQKIKSLQEVIASGKLSGEIGNKMLETAEKIPEWVRFELYILQDA